MKTRRLGSTGPDLSAVGFGAWAIGGPWEHGWGLVDDEESVAAIRHAVESGINWIDTAPIYGLGHSERVVGTAVAPYRAGEDVYLFTKCGRSWDGQPKGTIGNDLRPSSIRHECEQSLLRLGVERIDLYQIHTPDLTTGTDLESSWSTMVDLVDAGKVRWIGVSNFDVAQLQRCEAIRHVDSLQPRLSLLARDSVESVIPWAREHDTGVIVYSPLAAGVLSGSFDRRRIHKLGATRFQAHWSAYLHEPLLSRNLELVDRLKLIAVKLDTTLPALAVAWTLAQRGVTGAIVGARLAGQVDGWSMAPELQLDETALAEIDEAVLITGAGCD